MVCLTICYQEITLDHEGLHCPCVEHIISLATTIKRQCNAADSFHGRIKYIDIGFYMSDHIHIKRNLASLFCLFGLECGSHSILLFLSLEVLFQFLPLQPHTPFHLNKHQLFKHENVGQ